MALLEQVSPLPHLALVLPYEMEGTHTIKGTDKTLYLDHHWDNTFGHAFGLVGAVGTKVEEVAPGDFVYFTRRAYSEWYDEDGDKWLFVNKDDIQAIVLPGESTEAQMQVEETGNRVDRDAA